jgi:hypothetical protein
MKATLYVGGPLDGQAGAPGRSIYRDADGSNVSTAIGDRIACPWKPYRGKRRGIYRREQGHKSCRYLWTKVRSEDDAH